MRDLASRIIALSAVAPWSRATHTMPYQDAASPQPGIHDSSCLANGAGLRKNPGASIASKKLSCLIANSTEPSGMVPSTTTRTPASRRQSR